MRRDVKGILAPGITTSPLSAASSGTFCQILGVRFFNGPAQAAVAHGLGGGLVVVPAAPALVEMPRDPQYTDALLNADLAILDSAFLVLLWQALRGERLRRLSGLEYLVLLLNEECVKEPDAVLWIMPSPAAMAQNIAYLQAQGHPITEDNCYLAPMYDPAEVTDPELLQFVREKQPKHIIVGLGGGNQEKLGHYLKRNLSYKPGIHCIGAAIGFLSGEQARIPLWADRLYLGWFLRCLDQPKRFGPRYWKARHLATLMMKYGERLPDSVA